MPRRSIGAELRRRREQLGMTLTEFAREAGYSLKYASQIELGHGNAGPRYLREAARLFNCDITDISTEYKPKRRRRKKATASAGASAEKDAVA
jgi:transcriptional regulator with XRE-family HTH domain